MLLSEAYKRRLVRVARLLTRHPAATAHCPKCCDNLLKIVDGHAPEQSGLWTVERFLSCNECDFRETILMRRMPHEWVRFPLPIPETGVSLFHKDPIYEALVVEDVGWRLITWLDDDESHVKRSQGEKRWMALQGLDNKISEEHVEPVSL